MIAPTRPWRIRPAAADLGLAAGFAIFAVAGSVGADGEQQPGRAPLDLLAWACIGLVCAALIFWRVRPVSAFVAVHLAVIGYLIGVYPYGPIFLAVILVMLSVALRAPAPRAAWLCAGALVTLLTTTFVVEWPVPTEDAVAYLALWGVTLVTPLLAGIIVRLRRERAAREHEAEVSRRSYEERLRVAREVHDVVAHGLSVISMQSAAALHVLDHDRAAARHAMQAVRDTSTGALRDLRRTLGTLREPDGAGLDRLDALVDGSGLAASVDRAGVPRALPPPVDQAAYRIVQEALTNVMRHAGTDTVTVRVAYQPDGVLLEVIDDGRGGVAQDGHGIVGMRERAEATGGTLAAGPGREGGFAVRAWLPTPEAA